MTVADERWETERLVLEPLVVGHAAELHAVLDDPALHEFVGGRPLALADLAERLARWQTRRSADGREVWGNWLLRDRATAAVVGTVQATLPSGGPGRGPAEVAWVVASAVQGRGFATDAARSLVARLAAAGWSVQAHIHPDHVASQRVARAAGLAPTGDVVEGEVRWATPAGSRPPAPGTADR
ncbi:MAG: GNAT family N-acetyltransferase [Actinomycetes bacterium]